LLTAAYTFRARLLSAIGNFLVIHDRIEPVDIIFLLNGDPTLRPYQAVALFRNRIASKVVIARAEDSAGVKLGAYPNVTDSNITMLEQLGVPESRIVELRPPEGVNSTFDEAQALLVYCRERGIHSVVIVTSDFHSRRARYIFRKELKGAGVKVLVAPISDRKYGAGNWWTIEDGVIGCENEYLKLIYYHWKY
jgi:uncharacterized SAM-binding protein YcdF (DUF218 family)